MDRSVDYGRHDGMQGIYEKKYGREGAESEKKRREVKEGKEILSVEKECWGKKRRQKKGGVWSCAL